MPFIRVPAGAVGGNVFPLSISANARHLVDANGTPLFLLVDAAWSAVVNLTPTQITALIDDSAAKGFTGILVNAIENGYSNQSPLWRNVGGQDPFTTMSPVAWTSRNNSYWTILDYLVDYAKGKGLVVLIAPCYFGLAAGSDGWYVQMNAAADADLVNYGQFLGSRYTQGNVIWVWGGDYDGDATSRAKQRQILSGIRSVRTTDLNTFHSGPNAVSRDVVSQTDYPSLINWVYTYEFQSAWPFSETARAYAMSSPVTPTYFGEGSYENRDGADAKQLRRQSYSTWLAGALAGVSMGNEPIWNSTSGYAAQFNSTGRIEQSYFAALVRSVQWWKLQPKTDSSLVTSSKGGTSSPVCPALASDGTFALIYVPAAQTVTVNTNALTGVTGNVRIRIYSITAGTYSAVATEAKAASRDVTTSADCVVVIDQG